MAGQIARVAVAIDGTPAVADDNDLPESDRSPVSIWFGRDDALCLRTHGDWLLRS